MVLKQCCVSRSHHFTKLSLELWTRQNPAATTQLTASEQGRYEFEAQLPRDQEVLVFEEQGLCDEAFVASQPVQSTFVDDVPHDNVGVLKRRRFLYECDQICHKKNPSENPEIFPTHLGACDQPSSKLIVAYDADGRLVAIEGNVALAVQEAEYPHRAVLVTYRNTDAIG